jgi:hypothetical protein
MGRWLWLSVKYGLAALGAVLWLTLWFERGFWLGVVQFALLGWLGWQQFMGSPPPAASDREVRR